MTCCVWCEYDLTGIAEGRACPECGLLNEPDAFVIQLRYRPDSASLAAFLIAAPVVYYFLNADTASGFWLALAITLFISICGFAFRSGAPEQLIVGPSGVTWCKKNREIVSIPWNHVDRIYQSFYTAKLVIRASAPHSTIRVTPANNAYHRSIPKIVQRIKDTQAEYLRRDMEMNTSAS